MLGFVADPVIQVNQKQAKGGRNQDAAYLEASPF